jgi:hypothetical protein
MTQRVVIVLILIALIGLFVLFYKNVFKDKEPKKEPVQKTETTLANEQFFAEEKPETIEPEAETKPIPVEAETKAVLVKKSKLETEQFPVEEKTEPFLPAAITEDESKIEKESEESGYMDEYEIKEVKPAKRIKPAKLELKTVEKPVYVEPKKEKKAAMPPPVVYETERKKEKEEIKQEIKEEEKKPEKEKKPIETDFAIGIGYPYVSLKYGINDFAFEAKGAFGSGIKMFAGRLYYYFLNMQSGRLFTALEGGYIDFDDVYDISGKGWQLSAALGLEAFATDWLSVSVDFAPMYINLESNGQDERGIEYVVSAAVYIYLW